MPSAAIQRKSTSSSSSAIDARGGMIYPTGLNNRHVCWAPGAADGGTVQDGSLTICRSPSTHGEDCVHVCTRRRLNKLLGPYCIDSSPAKFLNTANRAAVAVYVRACKPSDKLRTQSS